METGSGFPDPPSPPDTQQPEPDPAERDRPRAQSEAASTKTLRHTQSHRKSAPESRYPNISERMTMVGIGPTWGREQGGDQACRWPTPPPIAPRSEDCPAGRHLRITTFRTDEYYMRARVRVVGRSPPELLAVQLDPRSVASDQAGGRVPDDAHEPVRTTRRDQHPLVRRRGP